MASGPSPPPDAYKLAKSYDSQVSHFIYKVENRIPDGPSLYLMRIQSFWSHRYDLEEGDLGMPVITMINIRVTSEEFICSLPSLREDLLDLAIFHSHRCEHRSLRCFWSQMKYSFLDCPCSPE